MPRPPPPFPVKKRAKKIKPQDREYQRFVQMLKEVKINISAHELFTGVPKYAKFFKTMLSNKEDIAEEEMVELSAKCSSLFEKDISLPKKLKDPGNCTIPYTFGDKATYKALYDLGSGVNIMPRSIAEELDLVSEIKYTSATLMLADRLLIKPQRIVKDVCVGIGKFSLPCDFMILEVNVHTEEVPLILGRPFMATGDAWLGVKDKIVVFQVNGEKVAIDVDNMMKQPSDPPQPRSKDHVQ